MCRFVAYLGPPVSLQALIYEPPHGLGRSSAVLAAVRDATPPSPVEERGTPPFTSGPWLFAHNGRVDGFAGGRPAAPGLCKLISDDRLAPIEGASDSEVLSALTLDRLDAGAEPGPTLADVVAAVGHVAPAPLNLVLTDGHRVAVAPLSA